MTETFEQLMKSCAKFNLLFVNIQCATACSLEKLKFKIKLLYLFIRIKFTAFVARILPYKGGKFGSNPCYHN